MAEVFIASATVLPAKALDSSSNMYCPRFGPIRLVLGLGELLLLLQGRTSTQVENALNDFGIVKQRQYAEARPRSSPTFSGW